MSNEIKRTKKFHFIYVTTHIETGKYYIGRHSTNNIEDGYMGSGIHLKRAISLYGKKAFKTEILEYADSFDALVLLETKWIDKSDQENLDCYNIALGGMGGQCGVTLSEEAKAIRSAATLKRYEDRPELKKAISDSIKKIMKERGRNYWSEEGYAKILETLATCPKPTEYHWSEESREIRRRHMIASRVWDYERTPEILAKFRSNIVGRNAGVKNAMAKEENRKKVGRSKIGRKLMFHFILLKRCYVLPCNIEKYKNLGFYILKTAAAGFYVG